MTEQPKFTLPPFVTLGMSAWVSRRIASAVAGAIAYEQQVIEIRAITNTSEAEVIAAAQADPYGLAGVRERALRGEWP